MGCYGGLFPACLNYYASVACRKAIISHNSSSGAKGDSYSKCTKQYMFSWIFLFYCQADDFHRFTGLSIKSMFYNPMILNPMPGIDSEYQVKIKDKNMMTWGDLGCFKFMVKLPKTGLICMFDSSKDQ